MSTLKLDELAIFGGPPRFADPVHVGRPAVGNIELVLKRIRESLESRWLTNDGPFVQEFERRICNATKTKHAIAISNATLGLQLAIRALGMKGAVIVPSYTFVATAQALHWQGITPVFCEVDPETHCIDINDVEQKMSPEISGIIGVHLWGRACNVEGLADIASRHNVPLLLDAAQAFGAKHDGVPIGGNGAAEVFSFHATKFVNSFEGGAITTNDQELADQLRLMRNFGFEDYDKVVQSGTNAKMCEPAAAMGITSLESAERFLAINRENLAKYREGLQSIPGITFHDQLLHEDSNCQYAVVEVNENEFGLSRDQVLTILRSENILARKYFSPGCHQISVFCTDEPPSLPVTESLCDRVLQLPTGNGMTVIQIEQVCNLVQSISMHADEIGSRMKESKVVPSP